MTDDPAVHFPGLQGTRYQVTSPPERRYNCIAWAAGDSHRWWEPDRFNLCYWPSQSPRELTLPTFIEAFRMLGFELCESAALEPGFEKIAFFADSGGTPKHAARQLPSGQWTSKLGRWVDIEHELYALEGTKYGAVNCMLKRPTAAGEPTPSTL